MEQKEIDSENLAEEAEKITKGIIDEVVEWVCNLKNIENASDTVKKNIAAQAEVALDVACEGVKKAGKAVTPERLSELVKTLIEKGTDPEFPEAVYYDNLTDNPNVIDDVIGENEITDALEDICGEDASLMAAENEDPYEIVAAAKEEETDLEAAEGYEEDDGATDAEEYEFLKSLRRESDMMEEENENTERSNENDDLLEDAHKIALLEKRIETMKSELNKKAKERGLNETQVWAMLARMKYVVQEETDNVESLTESIEPGTKAEQLYNTMLKAAEDLGTVTDEIRSKIEGYITFLKNKYTDEQKMEEVFDNGDDTDKGVDNCEAALEKIFNGEVPSMNEEETVDDMVREAEEEDYEAENS